MGPVTGILTIDVDRYLGLAPNVRRAFDQWLRDEDLLRHDIWRLRLGEGYIEANCYLRPLRPDPATGKAQWEPRRIPVSTPPPRGAFLA